MTATWGAPVNTPWGIEASSSGPTISVQHENGGVRVGFPGLRTELCDLDRLRDLRDELSAAIDAVGQLPDADVHPFPARAQ